MKELYNENFISVLKGSLKENRSFILKDDEIEAFIKETILMAGIQLGAKKNTEKPYYVVITRDIPEDVDTQLFAFGVIYNKGETEDNPGNFSIYTRIKPELDLEDANVDRYDECAFIKRIKNSLLKNYGFSVTGDYARGIISEIFESVIRFLEANKSEEDSFSLDIPGYISFVIAKKDDKFEMGAIADAELKKRIKSDDALADASKEDK